LREKCPEIAARSAEIIKILIPLGRKSNANAILTRFFQTLQDLNIPTVEDSNMKYDIGIIGAMPEEVEGLTSMLKYADISEYMGIAFHTGELCGKKVVIAQCGVGKVFAAACASAMILMFKPSLIINTGVGGGLKSGIKVCDIVVGERLCQHDMDTSPIGDPKGLISGINKIYFESDKRAAEIVLRAAAENGINCHLGTIASGDQFVAASEEKSRIVSEFSAHVCEMEGAAIAQTAYIGKTPFTVIRAISDGADEGSSMDYMKFLPIAAKATTALVLALIKEY
jgi:adenosylhomocysteine nucleosidase